MSLDPDPDQKIPLSGRALASAGRRFCWSSLGLGVVGACTLLLTVNFALSQRATGRVVAGVHVAELDVSQLTRDDVRARVRAWAEQRSATPLTFSLAGGALTFEPKSAGFQVDADAAAERALT